MPAHYLHTIGAYIRAQQRVEFAARARGSPILPIYIHRCVLPFADAHGVLDIGGPFARPDVLSAERLSVQDIQSDSVCRG
jgi:hypothetical protein